MKKRVGKFELRSRAVVLPRWVAATILGNRGRLIKLQRLLIASLTLWFASLTVWFATQTSVAQELAASTSSTSTSSASTLADIELQPVGGDLLTIGELTISELGQLQSDQLEAELELEDLRKIDFPDPASPVARGKSKLILRGGSTLFVDDLSLVDEICRARLGKAELEFGLEAIQAIQLDATQTSEVFDEGAAEPLSEYDRIYLRVEQDVQSVQGVVESIQDGNVTFLFEDDPREFPLAQLFGFVVADFGEAAPPAGNATIKLVDGSRLLGQVSMLDSERLTATVGQAVQVEVPRSLLDQITLRSDRLLFLSDVEPLRAEMRPLVTLPREYQRDRSVDGHPLSLFVGQSSGETSAVRVFERGLGTHAESLLEFENPGFDRFVAVIGIDAETAGKGDCVFIVRGDGETLLEQRMQATDPPFSVELTISGKKRLILEVQAGQDLDLADHANWCEARLLKNRE